MTTAQLEPSLLSRLWVQLNLFFHTCVMTFFSFLVAVIFPALLHLFLVCFPFLGKILIFFSERIGFISFVCVFFLMYMKPISLLVGVKICSTYSNICYETKWVSYRVCFFFINMVVILKLIASYSANLPEYGTETT